MASTYELRCFLMSAVYLICSANVFLFKTHCVSSHLAKTCRPENNITESTNKTSSTSCVMIAFASCEATSLVGTQSTHMQSNYTRRVATVESVWPLAERTCKLCSQTNGCIHTMIILKQVVGKYRFRHTDSCCGPEIQSQQT